MADQLPLALEPRSEKLENRKKLTNWKKRKNRLLITAYLLWFFLGIFGAHRLFLKRIISGNLYLSTLGIFGVGWLIDSIYTWRMVLTRIQELKEKEESLEERFFNDFERLEKEDEKQVLVSSRKKRLLSISFSIFSFLSDAAVFIFAAVSIFLLLIYFDLILIAFPIIVIWIVLILNNKNINSVKDNVFIIKDMPINVENSLFATTFKVLHFQKGYKLNLIKYLFYPVYFLAYLLSKAAKDKHKSEFKELFLFFRLYSGIFLFWLTIEMGRFFINSNLHQHALADYVMAVHPLYLIKTIILDNPLPFNVEYILLTYVISIFLFGLLMYFLQLTNVVILRNKYDLSIKNTDYTLPFTLRIIIIALIIVFSALSILALFNDDINNLLEKTSRRKYETALYLTHQEKAIKNYSQILEYYFLNESPDILPLQSLIYKLLNDSCDPEKNQDYGKYYAQINTLLEIIRQKVLEKDIIDSRYAPYLGLYPVFLNREEQRYWFIYFTVSNIETGPAFSPFQVNSERRSLFPLLVITASQKNNYFIQLPLSLERQIRQVPLSFPVSWFNKEVLVKIDKEKADFIKSCYQNTGKTFNLKEEISPREKDRLLSIIDEFLFDKSFALDENYWTQAEYYLEGALNIEDIKIDSQYFTSSERINIKPFGILQ